MNRKETELIRRRRIPIGLGYSPHPVRRQRRFRPRWVATVWSLLGAVLGLVAGAIGVFLWLSPAQSSVSLDGGAYRIGGQTFEARGGGVYRARDGAALVIERRGDQTLAAASTELNGRHVTGRCKYSDGGKSERCRFMVGTTTITANDDRTPDGWRRRYADGQAVDIRVTGRQPVPVPFAVGR